MSERVGGVVTVENTSERGPEPSLATATRKAVAGAKRPARQGQEREG
jgi:hypothetical protein